MSTSISEVTVAVSICIHSSSHLSFVKKITYLHVNELVWCVVLSMCTYFHCFDVLQASLPLDVYTLMLTLNVQLFCKFHLS